MWSSELGGKARNRVGAFDGREKTKGMVLRRMRKKTIRNWLLKGKGKKLWKCNRIHGSLKKKQ